jgi:hypothetical protein
MNDESRRVEKKIGWEFEEIIFEVGFQSQNLNEVL